MLYTKEQIGATTTIKTRKADMATDIYQRASSMNTMFNEEDMQGIRARNTFVQKRGEQHAWPVNGT